MLIHEHVTQFAGKPVVEWTPDLPLDASGNTSYAIRVSGRSKNEPTWEELFAMFLSDPHVGQVSGLVVGSWLGGTGSYRSSSAPIVEALVAARPQLPNLRALFLGDILSEENEISWIQQSDVSPLFEAYPNLTELWVRGGSNLSFDAPKHAQLKKLVVQSGGMDSDTVRQIAAAEFPNLEHLELWLGTEEYGGDATMEDIEPLLEGSHFPNVNYLGLCNSELSDDIAKALQDTPILSQLSVLDLSLGTLSDIGAQALLDNPQITSLKTLDIHYHFVSNALVEKLQGLGIHVNADEPQGDDDDEDDEMDRYVAVGE